jgi:hypothetical protein
MNRIQWIEIIPDILVILSKDVTGRPELALSLPKGWPRSQGGARYAVRSL